MGWRRYHRPPSVVHRHFHPKNYAFIISEIHAARYDLEQLVYGCADERGRWDDNDFRLPSSHRLIVHHPDPGVVDFGLGY